MDMDITDTVVIILVRGKLNLTMDMDLDMDMDTQLSTLITTTFMVSLVIMDTTVMAMVTSLAREKLSHSMDMDTTDMVMDPVSRQSAALTATTVLEFTITARDLPSHSMDITDMVV